MSGLQDKKASFDVRVMGNLGIKVKLGIVKLVLLVYDFVTFPVYFLLQKPWRIWNKFSIVWAKPIREEDPYSAVVRVARNSRTLLEGVTTMDEMFRKGVVTHGGKKCLGFREILGEEEQEQNGKTLRKLRLADYKWLNYHEVDSRVEMISRGMLAIGIQPKQQIVIFAETRLEWILIAQACFRINVPVATLYATLGDDGVVHGMNETEVTHIFTSNELLPKLKKLLPKIPRVTNVIYMEGLTSPALTGFSDKVSIIALSNLESLGTTCDPCSKPDPPSPHDVAIIMYTSGSTGIPKGVMMTHKNCVTTTSGLTEAITELRHDDMYIAYLPLAHILEISAECFFLIMGVPTGYSSPHTLTDKSTAIIPGSKGDAALLKPTVLAAVPLMLDRIRKSVLEVVSTKGQFAQELFLYAVKYKHFWWKRGFKCPIMNRLMFKKIQQLVGGRVRVIACGGAPLSPDTHDFIRACLDITLLQGYGMTETAGTATIMAFDDVSTGRVGASLSSCYLRLVDWKEGGYRATDKPHPRGEIVIGGDAVTLGYFKNDVLTKESFVEEDGIRWFYTADIGELFPDGTIKIIDRKKDLVKLQFGEYISLGKVEAEMKTCSLIDNICVVGNGFHSYLVALAVPNQAQLTAIAKEIDRDNLSFKEMCSDPEILAEVTRIIEDHGRKCRLQRSEIPTKVTLCSEEWLPDTGLVTAAFKLRRKYIQQHYQHAIDEMYCNEPNGTTQST